MTRKRKRQSKTMIKDGDLLELRHSRLNGYLFRQFLHTELIEYYHHSRKTCKQSADKQIIIIDNFNAKKFVSQSKAAATIANLSLLIQCKYGLTKIGRLNTLHTTQPITYDWKNNCSHVTCTNFLIFFYLGSEFFSFRLLVYLANKC